MFSALLSPLAGEGVAYDQASNTVVGMGGGAAGATCCAYRGMVGVPLAYMNILGIALAWKLTRNHVTYMHLGKKETVRWRAAYHNVAPCRSWPPRATPLCACRAMPSHAIQSVLPTMSSTPCPRNLMPCHEHALPSQAVPCHAAMPGQARPCRASNARDRHDAEICMTCISVCRGAGRRRQHHRCHRRWACTGVRRQACLSVGSRMLPRRFMLANMWQMAEHLAPQHMHLPSLIHAGRPAALRTAGCGAVTPVSALPACLCRAECDHASRP